MLLAGVIFTSCHKKTVPMTSSTTVNKKETVTTVTATEPVSAARVNMSLLATGQKIYEASCARCHELKAPADFTQARWVGIMNWMAPKARLDSVQKSQVLAYVQYNAKDAVKDKSGM